ncbi:hypothetical protein BH24ACT20_BH24ACT20_09910 [soil metagenome]
MQRGELRVSYRSSEDFTQRVIGSLTREDKGLSEKYTRKKFLKLAGLGTVGISFAATIGCEAKGTPPKNTASGTANVRTQTSSSATAGPQSVQTFRSRPDLRPPVIEVTTPARGAAAGNGYVLVAAKNGVGGEEHPSQDGPMIVDEQGRPVWLHPLSREEEDAMEFRAQRYRGKPVLTWWEGVHGGWGQGEYIIFDSSYREIARFGAGNGYAGDHHEFLITDRDTALILIYNETSADLSRMGGEVDGAVMDSIVQEIDIETGEVLFEWHSLDHVGLEESYANLSIDYSGSFDYFHINSIDVDDDDNLLLSARKTSAVYKINRETGEVIWRLDGKKSDFEMEPGSRTAYQHDALRQPDGTVTIFDNGEPGVYEQSYGRVLSLDTDNLTANLVREYYHPDKIFGETQGNMQVLDNGNVFIGWGSEPSFSEFGGDGQLLYSASLPPNAESYRAYRSPWTGRPDEKPAIAVDAGEGEEATVYASWNGATEVADWQVLAGPSSDRLKPVGSVAREGFETAIVVNTTEPYVAVQGRDSSNEVLGVSEMIRL